MVKMSLNPEGRSTPYISDCRPPILPYCNNCDFLKAEEVYADHASSLMTVGLGSGEDDESSGQSDNGDRPIFGGGSSQEDEVVVIDDDSDDDDDDDVVFVSSSEGNTDVPSNSTTSALFKPFHVVKPFGFASPECPGGNTDEEDEIVVVGDEGDDGGESEDCFRKLFEGLQKEYDEPIKERNDVFRISYSTGDTPYIQKELQVRLEAISEDVIHNYTLVKDCYVRIQRLRPKQGGKGRKSFASFEDCNDPLYNESDDSSTSEESEQKTESSEDSNDPLYIPETASPSSAKQSKKRRSDLDDPSYFPGEPNAPTRDISVYLNIPLNKNESKRSRITFCDRVLDLVGMIKSPATASDLCGEFWNSLSIRAKRKYLPRSKYSLCEYGGYDPRGNYD